MSSPSPVFSDIWNRLDIDDTKCLKLVGINEDLTRSDCIRRHIPQLRVCDMSKFDFSEDVLATMVCFQMDQENSVSNLKTFILHESDLNTLVAQPNDRTINSVDLEDFIRTRNFEMNQKILVENIKHNLAENEKQNYVDKVRLMAMDEEFKVYEEDLSDYFRYAAQLMCWCDCKDSTPESFSPKYKDRFIRDFGEFFNGPNPETGDQLRKRIYAFNAQLYNGFTQRQTQWQTSEYSAYQFRVSLSDCERDYCCQLQERVDLQVETFQRYPLGKEDLLLFAMQQDAFGCRIPTIVGESNQIYLVVFSTTNAVYQEMIYTVADLWKSRVNRAGPSAVVEVLYFAGKFRSEGSPPVNKLDPIRFIPWHARGDYGAPTPRGPDSTTLCNGKPPMRNDPGCEVTKTKDRNLDFVTPVLSMLKSIFIRWSWQPQAVSSQFSTIDSDIETCDKLSSSWSVQTPQSPCTSSSCVSDV
jgi:hypothetical protein